VNFAAEYRERVFASFLAEYSAGRTPNPDVLCNAEIKFKAFLDHAPAARRRPHRHRPLRASAPTGRPLRTAARRRPGQGQRYFLHRLNQEQLRQDPVPGRRPAQERGAAHRPRDRLPTPPSATRPASASSASGRSASSHRYLPMMPGPIRTPDGKVVGEHVGLAFYTLGQRKGIGVGGMNRSQGGGRLRRAVVRRPQDMAATRCGSCRGTTTRGYWQRNSTPGTPAGSARGAGGGTRLTAKTRYRQATHPAPWRASTAAASRCASTRRSGRRPPGSRRCLYDGEVCLGGRGDRARRLAAAGATPLSDSGVSASAAG